MKAILPGLAAASLAAVAVAACGNLDAATGLFSSGGGAGGAPTSASSSSGDGPAASTGPTGSTGASMGPASSSAAGSTAASSAASSSSASSASSTAGGALPVYCDTTQCADGQVCCFNPNGPGDHCGTAGMCDPGYIEISCTIPDACPNGFCCASVDFNQQVPYTGISCAPSCAGSDHIVICSQQHPEVCPPGTMCQQSQSLGPEYYICWPTM